MSALPNSPSPVSTEKALAPGAGLTALFVAEAALSFVGAGIAGTLWWAHRKAIDLPCTGDGRGCDLVAQSRWAHISVGPWTDVPVALAGLLGYVLLLAVSLGKMGADTAKGLRRLQVTFGVVCAVGTGFSWFLQWVAHFRVGAFCVWCFASACVMTLLLGAAIWEETRRPAVDPL